ncbi:MAG: esterase/lipase family protein, partial [Bryobacteraceae bacterium]
KSPSAQAPAIPGDRKPRGEYPRQDHCAEVHSTLKQCFHAGFKYASSTLTATGSPNGGGYSWNSSNTNIVELQANTGGSVSFLGKAPGQSAVSVTYTYQGISVVSTVKVTVTYPIIFVHGINSRAAAWAPIRAALTSQFHMLDAGLPLPNGVQDQGCVNPTSELDFCSMDFETDPVTTRNQTVTLPNPHKLWEEPFGNQSSFILEGKALARTIDKVITKTKAKKIILVAHSMGGLASRAVIQLEGQAPNVAQVITIGTPHQGSFMLDVSKDAFLTLGTLTYLAAMLSTLEFESPGVQSLDPDSYDLTLIANRESLPGSPAIKHVSIVSKSDPAVAAEVVVALVATSICPLAPATCFQLAAITPSSDLLVSTTSQNLNTLFSSIGAEVDTSVNEIHTNEITQVGVFLKYLFPYP